MGKHLKRIGILGSIVVLVWFGGLLGDAARLREDILRLHVVANSDSQEDQTVKLQVRDAILGSLEDGLANLTDAEQAVEYVREMLPKIEAVANEALAAAGFSETVTVSLTEEAFSRRDYDTFSLPAGIYQSLRVVIGEGEGQNWWCVVFPQMCISATSEEVAEVSGFSDTLDATLTGEYEIRFWLLDKLGQIRNFFFTASE